MKTQNLWRTLDEYSNFHEFQKALRDEFPPGSAEPPRFWDRREFLSVVSASLAFAGLTACAPSVPEKIVPYVRPPEDLIPGVPLFFCDGVSARRLRSRRSRGEPHGPPDED
jgi:molybdopterin-containing oxidoreductase family iron-sulfur binding subunit